MHVQIKNLQKHYGKKQVLKDITLSAEGGRCIGILGSNGCGKSTLLSILAGVLQPDSGAFFCDEKNLLKDPARRAALVGYVPQGTPLMEELTAKDNLLLWYDRQTLEQELKSGVLQLLGIEEFLKVPVRKLSGGMKKRLSIGCAMANRPPILLLDEPLAALDLVCKESIFRYLQEYKKAGGLLLLTTHDVMALPLCDECYIIKDGVLVPFTYDGNPETLVKSL